MEDKEGSQTETRRVLVVDDEQGLLELVEYRLRRAGYQVLLADTGRDGLRLAMETRPDMVVLDLMLPDLDGVEVGRRIRRHTQVLVLMLTARTDQEDQAVGLEVGADDYMTKPFHPRELVARVQALLQRSGADDAPLLGRLRFGELEVDVSRQEVRLAGEEVQVVSRQVCKRRFPSRTGSFASSGVENQGCLSLRPRHGQLGHRLHAQIPPLHPPLVLLLLQDGADQP